MTARFPLALFVSVVALFPALAGQQPDFRKTIWGMTQEQVKAAEPAPPVETTESDGEVVLRFEGPASSELPGRLLYIFVDNKLVRAKYISTATHEDPNDFIADFAALEATLLERNGKPTTDRAVWENDLFQQERLAYLDQDRAHASDILPSDRFTGLSISLGYLKMYTERATQRTQIVHALTGADNRILHQIEYRAR
jgi:hypothetical protein